jgi:hypothetical protein
MPDIANATLKLAVMNLKLTYKLAVYCEAMSTAPPAAPMMNYAALITIGFDERPSIAYAIISEIIMMVIDHLAPILSMNIA